MASFVRKLSRWAMVFAIVCMTGFRSSCLEDGALALATTDRHVTCWNKRFTRERTIPGDKLKWVYSYTISARNEQVAILWSHSYHLWALSPTETMPESEGSTLPAIHVRKNHTSELRQKLHIVLPDSEESTFRPWAITPSRWTSPCGISPVDFLLRRPA